MLIHIAVEGEQTKAHGLLHRPRPACKGCAAWVEWDWDGSALNVRVDRYGFKRLFYAPIGQGISVADTVGELIRAGADAAYDDPAVAVFLRMGYYIGNDTPFAAIRSMPIGGALTWTLTEGLIVKENRPTTSIDQSIGRSEALDVYVDLFRQAIAQSIPDTSKGTTLPLSGGRDSRHIAIELNRLGFRPSLVVSQRQFASRFTNDVQVAAALCERFGWPHVVSEQTNDPLRAEHTKNEQFEGMMLEGAWLLPMAEMVKKAGSAYVFDGIAGDVLSNGLFVREAWNRSLDSQDWHRLFRQMASVGCNDQSLAAVLRPDLNRRWSSEVAFDRWKREFDLYKHEDDPVSRFKFWNRTRRCIGSGWSCYHPAVDVITPYLDEAVFNHLTSLPKRHFLSRDFHDEAIARAGPETTDIPYAKDGEDNDGAIHYGGMTRQAARSSRYWLSSTINRPYVLPRLAAALVSSRAAQQWRWLAQVLPAVDGLDRVKNQMVDQAATVPTSTVPALIKPA